MQLKDPLHGSINAVHNRLSSMIYLRRELPSGNFKSSDSPTSLLILCIKVFRRTLVAITSPCY